MELIRFVGNRLHLKRCPQEIPFLVDTAEIHIPEYLPWTAPGSAVVTGEDRHQPWWPLGSKSQPVHHGLSGKGPGGT